MDIIEVINSVKGLSDCQIFKPDGIPNINDEHLLPDDVVEFYKYCGGVILFANSMYPIKILSPGEIALANPTIIGEIPGLQDIGIPIDDISKSWYTIADDFNGDFLTIDFSLQRLGKCYDSHHELHPGNSPIIAESFTKLFCSLLDNHGQRWYWLREDFISLGNAYE